MMMPAASRQLRELSLPLGTFARLAHLEEAACRRIGTSTAPGAVSRRAAALTASRSFGRGFSGRRCFSAAAGESGDEVLRQRLWRWGATSAGPMSKNEVVEVSTEPELVEEFKGVTAAACGSGHSAFIVDGQLYTFGANKFSQLGREDSDDATSSTGAAPAPVVIEDDDGRELRTVSVSLGGYHSAAVTEGGELWTWGWGGSFWYGAGALGHSGTSGAEAPTLVDKFVEDGEQVLQVACGNQHTIVLTTEGRLYSTGKGDFGRLGRGETCDEPEFEEIEYFSQSNDSVLSPNETAIVTKVGAGQNFSASLSKQGELWVWGRNDYGQLGLGEEAMGDMYSAERYPRLVRSLPMEGHRVVDFACGEHHLVALTSSGAIYEWGNRTWLEPHPVSLPSRHTHGLKDIVKVAAGDKFSFALTADGRLYSWGSKASGCLALGANCEKNILEPTLVPPEVFSHQRVLDIVASKWRCLAITQEDSYIS